MTIDALLQLMCDKKASDLFLRTASAPRARINGVVKILDKQVLSKDSMDNITNYLLGTDERKQIFKSYKGMDFTYANPKVGRFRVHMFHQRGSPAIVIRHVSRDIKQFHELGLPEELCKNFCQESRGMVLVCGPAGNGKTTSIASMIEYINNHDEKHIITIEDPIEFLFTDKKSLVNQRELEIDVPTYPMALRDITQESPDVIYIANIREVDTMKAALTATELGSFVISTLHTINAIQTISRIINFFPPHYHEEIRNRLSLMLKGILSLRLVPRKDGKGRVPAYESMVVTPTISALIRENKIKQIQEFIEKGEFAGMISFRKCLVGLVHDGVVDEQMALKFVDSEGDFNLDMKGFIKRL